MILLPGYTETQFVFKTLQRHLKRNGVDFTTIRYKPFTGDLRKQESIIKDAIKHHKNDASIYLLGHSMGGILARYYAMQNPTEINGVIYSTTPHNGTWISNFGLGKAARQMTPGSEFLNEIKDYRHPNSLNIVTAADNLICPFDSSFLGFNDVLLDEGVMHNGMMYHSKTCELIINHITHERVN